MGISPHVLGLLCRNLGRAQSRRAGHIACLAPNNRDFHLTWLY